jgi:hypothetical protein
MNSKVSLTASYCSYVSYIAPLPLLTVLFCLGCLGWVDCCSVFDCSNSYLSNLKASLSSSLCNKSSVLLYCVEVFLALSSSLNLSYAKLIIFLLSPFSSPHCINLPVLTEIILLSLFTTYELPLCSTITALPCFTSRFANIFILSLPSFAAPSLNTS